MADDLSTVSPTAAPDLTNVEGSGSAVSSAANAACARVAHYVHNASTVSDFRLQMDTSYVVALHHAGVLLQALTDAANAVERLDQPIMPPPPNAFRPPRINPPSTRAAGQSL